MTANPLFMPGPSGALIEYSATDLRQLIDATFTAGVISGGVVTQRAAGANRSVDVSAVIAVIDGTDIPSTQGKYLAQQPLTNVPLATAPTSGNSRIDSIIAQVLDGDQNGNPGVNDFIVTVQPGTPATTGSQVAPTLPASCVLLANVLVGPTVTTIVNANITDERAFAGPRSGGALLISSLVLGSPATDFTFSSIPGSYNHLRLVVVARSSESQPAESFAVQFNGDTGANYDAMALWGSNATGGGSHTSGASSLTSIGSLDLPGATATANVPGRLTLEIPCYSQSVFSKTGSWEAGFNDPLTLAAHTGVNRQEILWRSTDPITSIKVFPVFGPDFIAGSSAYLYGII